MNIFDDFFFLILGLLKYNTEYNTFSIKYFVNSFESNRKLLIKDEIKNNKVPYNYWLIIVMLKNQRQQDDQDKTEIQVFQNKLWSEINENILKTSIVLFLEQLLKKICTCSNELCTGKIKEY